VVSFGDEVRAQCFELVSELRRAGVAADMDYEGRSPKSQMRVANRLDAPLCLLLGPDEAARGEVTMRDMAEAEQWPVPRQEAVRRVRAWLAGQETPR
jgi:histidyl-tRNA synthetase